MKTMKHKHTEPPADQLRAPLIAREERRRRADAAHWRYAVPDYPAAFLPHERAALLAAPDPLAIPIYGLIFRNMDEWKRPSHLLDADEVRRPFWAAGLRFSSWRERHARTEAALAYLMDAGLVVPGIDCHPFKLGAKWWLDRIWRRWGLTETQIAETIAWWRQEQLRWILNPLIWRLQIDEPSRAIRRDYEAAAPMAWRLLRRLPDYAHLPEQHPPRGETYAEAERRYRQERADAA
jgi:hypothetical protein